MRFKIGKIAFLFTFVSLVIAIIPSLAKGYDRCDYYEYPVSNSLGGIGYSQTGRTGMTINVRQTPDFTGKIVATIVSGQSVQVTARAWVRDEFEGDDNACVLWYEVKRPSDAAPIGWVFAMYLSVNGSAIWQ